MTRSDGRRHGQLPVVRRIGNLIRFYWIHAGAVDRRDRAWQGKHLRGTNRKHGPRASA